jgi:hypothetical protein
VSALCRRIGALSATKNLDGGLRYEVGEGRHEVETIVVDMDTGDLAGCRVAMFRSPQRNPKAEFVAEQLKRVRWISRYMFVPGEGYLLEWLPTGSHRMMLLQIALKNSKATVYGLDRLDTADPATGDAIRDFWTACTSQLAVGGDDDTLPVFVDIIKSWKPR